MTNDDKVPLLTDIDYLIEKKTYKQIQIPGVARLNCNHPHAWDNEKYEKLIQVTFESQSISIYGFWILDSESQRYKTSVIFGRQKTNFDIRYIKPWI